jgi:beta-N-acetylhexosaminidase
MVALGVRVDLAPVLDVDSRPGPSAANADGARSFSGDPQVAGRYGVAFMRGLRDGGALPVVKHFPGLGGAKGNTDIGPVATRPLSKLRQVGLPPFQRAIAANAPAVMVANASVPGLTKRPASLSRVTINGLLRKQLGFHRLVVTDSLSAGAVQAYEPSLSAAAVAAVAAGADLVLFGSTLTTEDRAQLARSPVGESFQDLVDALVAAVHDGTISTQRLNTAVTHVLGAKHVKLCGA